MSAGHTPGPWTFDGPEWNLIVWSSPEDRVCFLAHSAGNDTERSFANARLISAAPDLLAVARLMIPQGVCLTNRNVRDDVIVALDVPMGDLRAIAAAIAKATGQ